MLGATCEDSESDKSSETAPVMAAATAKCLFCGFSKHPWFKCPARDANCNKCHRKGHYAKVCRSAAATTTTANCATLAATPSVLRKAVTKISIEGTEVDGLIDSGSSETFIHPDVIERQSLTVHSSQSAVTMAATSLSAQTTGFCEVDLKVNGHEYGGVRLTVLPQLSADVILGQDFQKLHDSVTVKYGGALPPLVICGGMSELRVDPPELFGSLTADCHPIAARSRRYSSEDRHFIEAETQRLLEEGIIEESNSSWRAQVVVVKSETRKKRLAIDYSQTINKFTLLDAFPLPRINDTVNQIAKYRVFSTIDLRSAYHQVH